jgi:hypothetical protein
MALKAVGSKQDDAFPLVPLRLTIAFLPLQKSFWVRVPYSHKAGH